MDATSGPVAPACITGTAPGLGWGTTGVAERVVYTIGERVRHRWHILPHMRLVQTDAALELRSPWREWMVVYVVLPLIGRIMEFSKLLMSFLTKVATMVWGEELNNNLKF